MLIASPTVLATVDDLNKLWQNINKSRELIKLNFLDKIIDVTVLYINIYQHKIPEIYIPSTG